MGANSNIRIAKNTLFLYIRMLFSLVVSLYTSRIVLAMLGAEDFGVYNVVGGVVVLFSFLTNAMTASTQRFLNCSIGLSDEKKTAIVFSTSILTHLTISSLILVLSETIGFWFVETQLNIPNERANAAMWVYQMSIVATLFQVMVIPYRASIIATERMSIFAYISILEITLKLVIALSLPYIKTDRLIIYSILITCISFFNFWLYRLVCRKRMPFTHFHFVWDKKQYKELLSFSGWYLFGGMAMVGTKQGTNILINVFYSVTVNAAVGVANQVRSAIYGFVTNFQTAFNPQIVKLYVSHEHDKLLKLIYRSSKFSYYLLFLLSFPVMLLCEEVLSIWLVEVPPYTVIFTQLVIIASFAEALSAPLWTAIGATGNIKFYQLFVSLIMFLEIPMVYIAFCLGLAPSWAFGINLIVSVFAFVYRLLFVKKYVLYNLTEYVKEVIQPCLMVSVMAFPIPFILKRCCCNDMSLINILLLMSATGIITAVSMYVFGLTKNERKYIIDILAKHIKK